MVLPATSTIKWLGCKTLEHPQCPKTNGRSWPWSEEDDEIEGGQKWQTREVFTKWQVFGEEWVIWTRQKFHACICSHRQLTCEITIWVILYMEKVNCLFLICTEVDDQFRWFVWSLGAFDKSCCLRQTFLVRIQIKQDRWNGAGENLSDGTFVRFVFRERSGFGGWSI